MRASGLEAEKIVMTQNRRAMPPTFGSTAVKMTSTRVQERASHSYAAEISAGTHRTQSITPPSMNAARTLDICAAACCDDATGRSTVDAHGRPRISPAVSPASASASTGTGPAPAAGGTGRPSAQLATNPVPGIARRALPKVTGASHRRGRHMAPRRFAREYWMRSEATTLPRILAAVMDRLVSNGDVPLQGLGASENRARLKGFAGRHRGRGAKVLSKCSYQNETWFQSASIKT